MSNAASVEALFFAALEKGSAAERAAYLNAACQGDAELRRQVDKLLAAHPRVGDFLKHPVVEQFTEAVGQPDATQEFDASTDGRSAVTAHGDFDFLQPSTRSDSLGRIGHYEVLQVLGQGGFGIVFRAFDETLQRMVAVKVLAPQLAATSPARKRFLREARSSAKVRHENVVRVYAVEEQPLPYLVMEFIPGETLAQRIIRTGPLETVEVVQFGRQIAEGLAAAHGTGLIHRDIKPANILIEAGPHEHVKITDFGLARAADDASLTQSGIVAGTPMYMAPEQAQGETLDHRADLFSLGSVLYTMCSGRPPFRANSTVAVLKRVVEDAPRPIPEIIPETPPWLCEIIARLHAKKPEDRIGTAREAADLLERGLAAMQFPANVPPAAVEKAPAVREIPEAAPAIRRPRFRARRWAAAAAALLLMVVGGLGFTEATGVTDVHGTVIRLFSPEGTLVVEVDDPKVSIKIDGSDLVITGAGAKEIRLKPGSYTVEASKDGKLVKQQLVTVTKDGKQVVRVSRVPPSPDAKAANEEKDPDRRAAEYVLSMGGTVKVNGQDQEIKLVATLPRDSFQLSEVFLQSNSQVTDAGLANFKDCKNLLYLNLDHTQVGDAGLANFKDCKNLTALYLSRTQVSDAGLAYFKDCKSLVDLELASTQVSDAGLAHFTGCKNLTTLRLDECTQVGDAGLANFKDCKNLTILYLVGTQASDAGLANFKDCKNLLYVGLNFTRVSDAGLAQFKDCKNLLILLLHGTQVSDAGLAPFKDCKSLLHLDLGGTQVSDAGLAHFTDCKNLTLLMLNGTQVSDAGLAQFKDYKNLTDLNLQKTKVTAVGIDELKKALPKCKIEWDSGVIEPGVKADAAAWERSVAALSAAEQVKAVSARLKELNPDFDGKVEPTIENGVVTGLGFQKEQVSDISPVRVFTKLRSIDIGQTQVSELTPLKGMPLRYLSLFCTPVSDLSPLKGMPLVEIQLMGSQAADLSPLKGMPLEVLFCSHTRVSDLSPLKGMPLRVLWINSEVSDLSPLKGMPLEHLGIGNSKVTDLAPLKGMLLRILTTGDSQVSDLSPLKGMPLEEFGLTPKNITQGLDILRDMKSLKTIDAMGQAWQAAEFWERYDKGEFQK